MSEPLTDAELSAIRSRLKNVRPIPAQDMEHLLAAYEEYRNEVDQLHVQLAGCGVAALGCRPFAVKGDFGWSASYGDVVTLREKYEASQKEVERLRGLEMKLRDELAMLWNAVTENNIEV